MKQLVPVAKPIRIRLRLHDTDCTSIEEVKRHFSYEELRPLFEDGRLKRWLEQIGMREKAKRAEAMLNDSHLQEREALLLLSLFFEHVDSFVSQLKAENKDWTDADFKKMADLNVLDTVYFHAPFYASNWSEVFDRFIDETSIFAMFRLPQYRSLLSTEDWVRKIASFTTTENWGPQRSNVEEQFDNNSLLLFIDCCANKGIEAAKQEKENKQEAERSNVSFDFLYSTQKNKPVRKGKDKMIEDFLNDPSNFYSYKIKNYHSKLAQFLVKLSSLYRVVGTEYYQSADCVKDYLVNADSAFDNERIYLEANGFRHENDEQSCLEKLVGIKDSYEPANYLYRWMRRGSASGLGTEFEHIEKYTNLKQDIEFVVNHLHDYNPNL